MTSFRRAAPSTARTFHLASAEFRGTHDVPRDYHGRWTTDAAGGHPGTTGRWFPNYDPLAEIPSGVPVTHRRFRKPLTNRQPRLRSAHVHSRG